MEQPAAALGLPGWSARRRGQRTTYAGRYAIASLLSLLPLGLARILSLFGSDKQRVGEHAYGAAYAEAFGRFRYRRIKLLEIGLLSGASLLAWRCYFPFATTVGADIEPKPQFAGRRTRVYTADQSDAADLDRIVEAEGGFDIIIDDGSHLSAHQIFTFRHLFARLRDGGLYVVEDVQTSFWRGGVRGFDWDGAGIDDPGFGGTCYGWFLELAKYVNHAEFQSRGGVDADLLALGRGITGITFQHNLIFVRKGDNLGRSNWLEG